MRVKFSPSGTVLKEMEQNQQPRVKKRHLLRSKKRRDVHNPHKVAPNIYFKPIWFSEPAHRGIKYISGLKKKSIGETANELMMQTIKDYIVGVVRDAARYEVELNELYRRGIDEKNARLWIALLRKVLVDRAASGT
ncbi:MAG: hypothetical protein Q7T57_09330 [Dehalococcoidales bacterium]|nr:hypothetical protein [Dehalococcoidales bacterium]